MSGTSPSPAPSSVEAEQSVVGQILADPRVIAEVAATALAPEHFFHPALRRLYAEAMAAYYADEAVDPLTIGELAAKDLARAWQVDEKSAVAQVQKLASGQRQFSGQAKDHAAVVRRHADFRALLDLAATIQRGVESESLGPDEIAGQAAQTAMQIATTGILSDEIIPFDDLGRRFVRQQRELMAAQAAGVELGAYFGLSFMDSFLRGLRPTELLFIAGDPGAGKSAVAWKAVQLFAERQMRKPADKRVGAFVLSLEMGEEPSNIRLAQTLTGLDGGKLREGRTSQEELNKAISEWGRRVGIPLYFNFTSTLKMSQLRALVVESIRRHNCGVVVIDHFKYVDADHRGRSGIEEDEDKAKFLKEHIAKDLNVAVICLAHTVKGDRGEDKRPTLATLRGAQTGPAAHADFVGMVHRPYKHASQEDIDDGKVSRSDAEMLWVKNRHGIEGTAQFHFDPSTMAIY